MAKLIDNKHSIGDTVYLKTDPEQLPRIVVCYMVYVLEVMYKLACGTIVSEHYDYELSETKNILADA